MAGVTGLEPAASGVTGRRSNQLSYTPYRAVVHGRRRSSACTASDSPSQGEARAALLPWSPRQISHSATEQCGEADPRGAGWWAVTVSNCRPPGCKPGALPAELTALIRYFLAFRYLFLASGQHLGQHSAHFVAGRVEHRIIAQRIPDPPLDHAFDVLCGVNLRCLDSAWRVHVVVLASCTTAKFCELAYALPTAPGRLPLVNLRSAFSGGDLLARRTCGSDCHTALTP